MLSACGKKFLYEEEIPYPDKSSIAISLNEQDDYGLKPLLKGLVIRSDIRPGYASSLPGFENPNNINPGQPNDWPKYVDGIVVQEEWANVQPTKAKLNTKTIDEAIQAVQSFNENHKNQELKIKLRIFAGIYSPEWVRDEIGSTALTFYPDSKDQTKTQEVYLPHFWNAPFKIRYENFQKALADKYDNHPLVSEIAITGCMIASADMKRSTEDVPYGKVNHLWSLINSQHKPLTIKKDFDCQIWQISAIAKIWKKTRISIARAHFDDYSNISKYRNLDQKQWPFKPDFMKDIVNECRLNRNCIIGNHSLEGKGAKLKSFSVNNNPLYYVGQKYVRKGRHAPIYFQTVTKIRDADNIHILNAIQYAIKNTDVHMIELPPLQKFKKYGYKSFEDIFELKKMRNQLKK